MKRAVVVEDYKIIADIWKVVLFEVGFEDVLIINQTDNSEDSVVDFNPDIILMDEPASALDPISTSKIEELIHELKEQYTIIIVTHNMQQAARVSDYTAFFLSEGGPGQMIEVAPTSEIFSRPKDQRTENYVTGRFG